MKCRMLSLIIAVSCALLLQTSCQKNAAETRKQAAIAPLSQTEKPESAKQTKGEIGPRIFFEKTIHDFGTVGPGSKNTCEFAFSNTGNDTLIIKDIKSTCSCTTDELKKRDYAPGESGTIKVTYNAGKMPGQSVKHLSVLSNDKTNPSVELTLKANIVPKVDYEPKQLDLSLKKDNAGCPDIVLKSTDTQPFSITQFESTPNCITAEFNPSQRSTHFVLKPKVDIDKLRKSLRGTIRIRLTHPECDMAVITFNTTAEFKTTPASIVAFNVETQKPISRELWIINNYNDNFEIESTSTAHGAIKVLSQEKIGDRYKLQLEITPPVLENNQKAFTDVLHIKIKENEQLDVSCRLFYLAKQ